MIDKVTNSLTHEAAPISDLNNISKKNIRAFSGNSLKSIDQNQSYKKKDCLTVTLKLCTYIWKFFTYPFAKLYEWMTSCFCGATKRDHWDITGDAWLYDDHLYYYFVYLSLSYSFKTCRFGLPRTLEELSNVLKTIPLHTFKELFLLPINEKSNHWSLLIYDPVSHTLNYFNSILGYINLEAVESTLKDVANDLMQKDVNNRYEVSIKVHKNLQLNSYDCGIWILKFAKKFLKNPNVDFNTLNAKKAQKMIARYRNHVQEVILDMRNQFSDDDWNWRNFPKNIQETFFWHLHPESNLNDDHREIVNSSEEEMDIDEGSHHETTITAEISDISSDDEDIDFDQTRWLDTKDLYYYFLYLSIKNYRFKVLATNHGVWFVPIETLTSVFNSNSFETLKEPFFIPVREFDNHWSLVVYDPLRKTLNYFNSKPGYTSTEQVKASLNASIEIIKEKTKDNSFVSCIKLKTYLQPDGYECGPWILKFAQEYLKNPEIDFNSLDVDEAQTMIAEYRKSIEQKNQKMRREYKDFEMTDFPTNIQENLFWC